MAGNSEEKFSQKETEDRFSAILRGAMHKPTALKDIPKKKRKAVKPSPSDSSPASE